MPKTLYEICEDLYSRKGQSAVYDYINKNHPEVEWRWCEPCEANSPADPTDQKTCLVCGSLLNESAKDDSVDWL